MDMFLLVMSLFLDLNNINTPKFQILGRFLTFRLFFVFYLMNSILKFSLDINGDFFNVELSGPQYAF